MDSSLSLSKQRHALALYMILSALFIAALVVCNLIANKFISIDLGFHTFVISAGVLPYPLTFLVTDLLSEFYGRRRTNQVVLSGFVVLLFVLGVLWLGAQFEAIDSSPVSESAYAMVFGNSQRVILASMAAYIVAQLVDVRLYHFWKNLTKGKHLWIRNNFSTMLSQFVDTVLVVGIIFIDRESLGTIGSMVLDGWLFKVLCAALDTPFMYAGTWLFRGYFGKPELAEH
ncbi:MAG: queuosine precursor transporter [Schleiferiaceae bacterium]|nr:queuosine precursor transporter [Schleiferiaceae bacterium]